MPIRGVVHQRYKYVSFISITVKHSTVRDLCVCVCARAVCESVLN